MRVAVLTTDTIHHNFFVRELAQIYSDISVFIETESIQPRFTVAHPFEKERDIYECNTLFGGTKPHLEDFASCSSYQNINDDAATDEIKSLNPDVVLVFGTGIIKSPLLSLMNQRIINLHGGDPEFYRGLDSHLWTIYHNDFDHLTTTIHHVNRHLDDGRIIMKMNIPIYKNMKLYHLRKSNTDVCIKLVRYALNIFQNEGTFPSIPQNNTGRYYSFMPSVLKDVCITSFEKHTGGLHD